MVIKVIKCSIHKYTKIWFWGMKVHHLATLVSASLNNSPRPDSLETGAGPRSRMIRYNAQSKNFSDKAGKNESVFLKLLIISDAFFWRYLGKNKTNEQCVDWEKKKA
jgi:hypothetical protein